VLTGELCKTGRIECAASVQDTITGEDVMVEKLGIGCADIDKRIEDGELGMYDGETSEDDTLKRDGT